MEDPALLRLADVPQDHDLPALAMPPARPLPRKLQQSGKPPGDVAVPARRCDPMHAATTWPTAMVFPWPALRPVPRQHVPAGRRQRHETDGPVPCRQVLLHPFPVVAQMNGRVARAVTSLAAATLPQRPVAVPQ